MNKKAKILSLCLAAVLLCACVVGFMMVGANAANEGYTHTWHVTGTADDLAEDELEDEREFATLQAALDAAKACEGQWGTEDNLQILIETATAQVPNRTVDGILFVETIWRGDRETEGTFGNKLPITIEGAVEGGTAKIGNGTYKSFMINGTLSYAYVSGGAATVKNKLVFANDYTFKNLTMDFKTSSSHARYVYAGSGNVTLDNVSWPYARTYFYGDNFAQAAYLGWTKEDAEAMMENNDGLIPSSFTFKNGTTLFVTDVPSSASNANLRQVCGAGYYGTDAEATDFVAATTGTVPQEVAALVKPANCSVGIIIPSDVTMYYPNYYLHNCPTDTDDATYYPAPYANIRMDIRNSSKFYLVRTLPGTYSETRGMTSNIAVHLYQDLSTLQYSDSALGSLLNAGIPAGKTFDLHLHNGAIYGIKFASTYGFCTSENSTLNITVHPNEDGSAATYTNGLDLIEYGANAAYANGNINVTIKSGVTINGSLKLYSKTGMRDFDDDGVHTNPVQATHTTTIEEGAFVENFMGPRGRTIINNIQGTVTNFFANTPTTRSSTTSSLDLSEADSVTNNIAATAEIQNFYGTGYMTRVSLDKVTEVTVTETSETTTTTSDTYRFYYFGEEIPEIGSEVITSTTTDEEAGTTTVKKECYTAHRLYNCEAETVINNIAAGASVGTFKATSSTAAEQNVTTNIADAQTFTAIDATVPGTFVLGENASITTDAIEGTINLSADAWVLGKVYLTYNGEDALAEHLGTTAAKDGGVLEVSGNTLVAATTVRASGNLALTDRIAVRFYFDGDKVATVGTKNVTLAVTLDGTSLNVGKITKDAASGDYYFEVYGITAKNLNDTIAFSGSILESGTTTLSNILDATKALGEVDTNEARGAALVALCESIVTLGTDGKLAEATKVELSENSGVYWKETGVGFQATGYGIAMNDAIGFTVYGAQVEGQTYTVKLNGKDITEYVDVLADRINIFVKVNLADYVMTIEILDAEGNADFKMIASVQELASLYENDEAANDILAYTQAALAYQAACVAA